MARQRVLVRFRPLLGYEAEVRRGTGVTVPAAGPLSRDRPPPRSGHNLRWLWPPDAAFSRPCMADVTL